MVSTNFTIASGVYLDEQDLAIKLDTFMTESISGWTRAATISGSSIDRDTIYYSDGSSPGLYDRNFVRVRGTTNELQFSVAADYSVSSGWTLSGVATSNDTEIPTGTTSGTYWFIGNPDSVYISVMHAGTSSKHFGGFGTWTTYYSPADDPKPYYVFGHQVAGNTFQNSRCLSYGVGSWGNSVLRSPSSFAGTSQTYFASHNTALNNAASQIRSGQAYIFEPVFYCNTTVAVSEVRGEMTGLHIIGGTPYSHGGVINITGIGTTSGKYFIHKFDNSTCWAIGKIAP